MICAVVKWLYHRFGDHLVLFCSDIVEVPCAPLVNAVKIVWAFFESFVDWLTRQLFRVSEQYRSVSCVLEKHKLKKKLVKQTTYM